MTTIIVSSGVTSTHLTLHNGDILEVMSGGKTTSITVSSGATEYVYSGGSAVSTTLDNGGGEQLSSGARASFTTVNDGGTLFVFSGGTALSTTVNNNGGEQVYADGTATVTTVHSGGTEFVLGGTAVSTTLDAATFEVVTSGGSAISTTVSSGATDDVYSDGTASFATVSSGGIEYVYQSGTTISTKLNSGGTEVVFPGATASATVVSNGGNLDEPTSTGSAGLKIDVVYDSSVAGAPAGFKTTVAAAVANLESLISTPITITITIDVGYGEVNSATMSGNLGQSESTGIDVSYHTLRNALLSRTATSDEIAAAASLPTNDPTSGGTFYLTYAEAEALDLSSGPGAGAAVGAIGLSNSLPFTYGTTNAVTPDTYDAFGVVEHEITEVMGRTEDLGDGGEYTPLDLFRYTSPGDRDLTPTAGSFSVNGTDLLAQFNDPSNGGDAGDWASSVLNDSFDAFSLQGAVNPVTATDLKVMDVIGFTPTVSCFAAGARIATARGEIEVQAIGVGDKVQVLLGAGFAEVIWVGRREVDCARHPNPRKVWPVRVAAGAFGPGRPGKELFLSPDHAVYVEDVLIPIKHLINGSTITQVPVARVTYHHIELAQHDVVLAEGLPVENFLDLRDGSNYTNRPGPIRFYPDYSACMWEAFGCARLVVTGPEFFAARALVAVFATDRQAA